MAALEQAFVAVPGVVAVIDSVVAGAAVGIAAVALDLGAAAALILGAVAFVVSLAGIALWAQRQIRRGRERLDPLFPTPSADDARRRIAP